jgi:hypothetical protein
MLWIHSQHPQEHDDKFPSPVQALLKITTLSDEKRHFF